MSLDYERAQQELAELRAQGADGGGGTGVWLAVGIAVLSGILALATGSYLFAGVSGTAVGWLVTRSAILSALRQWRREQPK